MLKLFSPSIRKLGPALGAALGAVLLGGCTTGPATAPGSVNWQIDNMALISGQKPEVLGSPKVENAPGGKAVVFDGVRDGLIVPANAIAGWPQFTIEVLFNPAADGAREQRFFHIQESDTHRALIEIRLTPAGQWSLDTFLLDGLSSKALMDPAKLHPAGQWYWVALRYDGQHIASFINGQPEMEGDVVFKAMATGQTSLGVRLNKVNWFKGAIREVRYSPAALRPEQMQRVAR